MKDRGIMIKVCLNSSLERAVLESKFFGEALFSGTLMNVGELFCLKDKYLNLWVHPSIRTNGDIKRLMIEIDDAPKFLEQRNSTLKNVLGKCLPSRFLCWVEFQEDEFTINAGRIFTQLNSEEIYSILKGEDLYDFAQSCLMVFLEKRVDNA
jgi:hypothetical protein